MLCIAAVLGAYADGPYKRPPPYRVSPLLYNRAWLDPKPRTFSLPSSETDLILQDSDQL